MSGTDFYYGPEIELAEVLAKVAARATPQRCSSRNSGSEANEGAS